MDKPDQPEKRVMDVSKPGRTAPDATSRPVLLKHKPVLQDPMFNASSADKKEADNPEDKEPLRTESKISPGGGQAPNLPGYEPEIPSDQPTQPPPPSPDQPTHQPAETPAQQPSVSASEQQPAAGQAPAAKSQADIQQLVHDKTYFMPITQPPRRYGLPWILLAVAILIMGVVAYLLLMTPS